MKNIVLALSAVLLLRGAGAAPQIQFDKETVELGAVYKYGYTNGCFVIRNVGDQALTIGVTPDCGCTTARAEPGVLHPGESGRISFTLRLNDVDGEATKGIDVHSNDPKRPEAKLGIHAVSMPLFDCSPADLRLESLPPGCSTNFIVSVQRADHQKVNITKVDSSDRAVTADADSQASPDGLTANIWIHMRGRDSGPFESYLLVYVDQDILPSFFYNIDGNVLPDVGLTPQHLFWGIDHPETWTLSGDMSSRTIEVKANRPGDTLRVRRATTDIPNLVMEIGPGVASTQATIIASMKSLPQQSLSGKITIEVESPKVEVMSVPVNIAILGR